MNTLSIFLGSSFLLRNERVLIGDGIRKLSDKWEQKGVRIHLLIWEDYRSEFTGESKQKEYDRDLVEKSDIVFAMFSNQGILKHQLPVKIANLYDYLNALLRQYLIVTKLYSRHSELTRQNPKISREQEAKLLAQELLPYLL